MQYFVLTCYAPDSYNKPGCLRSVNISKLNSKDFSTLNQPDYNCNYCNHKQNVDKPTGTISNKSNSPSNNQDYSDNVK